jgi:hypothetical protein
MFHFQCIILSKTCCGKNAKAAESGHICQLLSVFQCSVAHSRVALAVTIKAGICLVHVCCFSILAFIVSAVSYIKKQEVKMKGVP